MEDNKKITDLIVKVVLIIIIIILLIHNCTLMRKNDNNEPVKVPSGNVDIIEITCHDNQCKPINPPAEKPSDNDNNTNTKTNNNKIVITSLSFRQSKVSIKKGEIVTLIAVVKPSSLSSSKLTWTSSDPTVATVDANGKVHALKEGTVTITVTSANGKMATCTVDVTTDNVDVTDIKLEPVNMEIKVGSTDQILSTIYPENATNRNLTWTSSDPSIVTVDEKGVIHALKEGTVTITVTSSNGKKSTCTVTVKPNIIDVLKVELNPVNATIEVGSSAQISANVLPNNATDKKVTWTSSDPSIATVDENGNIKALKEGTVTITVTSTNGKRATCTIKVINKVIPVEEIKLDRTDLTIKIDESKQIKATVLPNNATDKNIVWESSDPSIATVDSNGNVLGIKEGNVTITAKTIDGKVTATCNVKVEYNYIDDALNVYDQDKTPVKWNGSTDLKIFSKSYYTLPGVIAPESEDIYEFEVKNKTAYNLKYEVKFHETNDYNINMKYKLRKNDTYLIDHYVNASELDLSDILLNVNETDTYYLEWKWVSSENDTAIGKDAGANYGLKIEINAESVNG